MEVDRKFIINTSKATDFQPDIIEKAYRLILLLKEINNHPVLSKELLLKGGTAINFVYLSLVTRGAARDLFDVYSLLKAGVKFRKPLLKKVFVFFGCLDRSDFRKFSPDSIDSITEKEIKTDLLPLLRKGVTPSRAKMIKDVKPFLEDMLTLNKHEKEYVNSFFKGEYNPELLFAKEEIVDLESLKNHPMALWKQQYIKEWLKSRSSGDTILNY